MNHWRRHPNVFFAAAAFLFPFTQSNFAVAQRLTPVVNLDVEWDHAYRIGRNRIVSHNESTGVRPDPVIWREVDRALYQRESNAHGIRRLEVGPHNLFYTWSAANRYPSFYDHRGVSSVALVNRRYVDLSPEFGSGKLRFESVRKQMKLEHSMVITGIAERVQYFADWDDPYVSHDLEIHVAGQIALAESPVFDEFQLKTQFPVMLEQRLSGVLKKKPNPTVRRSIDALYDGLSRTWEVASASAGDALASGNGEVLALAYRRLTGTHEHLSTEPTRTIESMVSAMNSWTGRESEEIRRIVAETGNDFLRRRTEIPVHAGNERALARDFLESLNVGSPLR